MTDGVLVVFKPSGPTSHDVVKCARRALGIRRIGHTGTLDPLAAGVLPLVLGQATRLAQHLTGTDKEYLATLRFGLVTDTYDASGEVVQRTSGVPTTEAVAAALRAFVGTYDQAPPLYSAKMVGGERAYVRARAGKPVQPPPVRVIAHALDLLDHQGDLARVRVRSSAGFYVRSLAHDVGLALGVGAILHDLVRTEAAGYREADAVSFETLVTAPKAVLLPLVRPLEALMSGVPSVVVTPRGESWVRHGRDLGPDLVSRVAETPQPLTRLMATDGRLLGLAEPARRQGFLHPVVVFS
ncbi:MAG: tRNA pseudouridine(55) synthase TruB [Acidobacteriota bacterium]